MYLILRSSYADKLCDHVNQLLKQGWSLHGETIFVNGEFCQPMIKLTSS